LAGIAIAVCVTLVSGLAETIDGTCARATSGRRVELGARTMAIRVAAFCVCRIAHPAPADRLLVDDQAGSRTVRVAAGVVTGVAHGARAHGKRGGLSAVPGERGRVPGDGRHGRAVAQLGTALARFGVAELECAAIAVDGTIASGLAYPAHRARVRTANRIGRAGPVANGIATLSISVADTGSAQRRRVVHRALTVAVVVAAAVVGRVARFADAHGQGNQFGARTVERGSMTADTRNLHPVRELGCAQPRLGVAELSRLTIAIHRARVSRLADSTHRAHSRAASRRGVELGAGAVAVLVPALGVAAIAHQASANDGSSRGQAGTLTISETAGIVREVTHRAAADRSASGIRAGPAEGRIMAGQVRNGRSVRELGRAQVRNTVAELIGSAVAVHRARARLLANAADRTIAGSTHRRRVLRRAWSMSVRISTLVILCVTGVAPALRG